MLVMVMLSCLILPAAAQHTESEIKDLISQITILSKNELNDSAFALAQQLVDHLERTSNNTLLNARGLTSSARCYLRRSNYLDAQNLLSRSLAIQKELPIDVILYSSTLEALAWSISSSDRDSSKRLIDLALGVLDPGQEAHKIWRAHCLQRLARWFHQEGTYDSSRYYVDQVFEILNSNPSEDLRLYVDAHRLKAQWYEEQGDQWRALDLYDQAAQIFAEKYPPDHLIFSYLDLDHARILTYQNKSLEAKQRLLHALDIKLSAHGKFHNGTAYTYQLLGNICNQLENAELAIHYNKQAIEINDSLYGSNNRWSANIYNNLGISYGLLEDEEKALSSFYKSIADNTVVLGPDNYELPYPFLNLGDHYLAKEVFEKAQYYYTKSLNITDRLYGYSYRLSLAARLQLGEVALSQGFLDKASEVISEALIRAKYDPVNPTHFAQIEYPSLLVDLLVKAAKIKEQQWLTTQDPQYLMKGLQFIRTGDAFIVDARKKFSEDGSKLSFAKYTMPLYEQGLQLTQQRWQELGTDSSLQFAWHLMEGNRSLDLLETLYGNEAMTFGNIPDSILQQAREVQKEILQLEKEVAASDNLPASDRTRISTEADLARARIAFAEIMRTFEKDHPAYYHLKYQPSTMSLAYLQKMLGARDAGFLSYFLGQQGHFVMAITADTAALYKLNAASISEVLPEFLESVSAGGSTIQDSIAPLYRLGQELYAAIFDPIKIRLPEHLIIAPDGALAQLSFDALLYDDLPDAGLSQVPFLVRRHRFSYVYSAALLQQLEGSQSPGSQKLYCFAPNFDLEREDGQWEVRGHSLAPLIFNEQEVKEISRITGGQALIGTRATRERFERVVGQAQMLHLSTHAIANDQVGDSSFLAFESGAGPNLLFVRDLYGMSVPAEMVVLSACQSAAGQIKEGEGIISLARGFFYAGTQSLISSLWNLNDEIGSRIMIDFYTELTNKKRKDEALRNAKLKHIDQARDMNEIHPYYWAGLICMGKVDAVSFEVRRSTLAYIMWGFLLIVCLLLLRKFLPRTVQ